MNRRKEQRAAAIDLWKQMLERMRANEWSTFVNPEWTPSEEEKCNFRQAFIDAGWSEQECEERSEALEAYADNAPVTSEGVARSVEAILDRCSTSVLTAAKIAGIGSVDHVYFAVEPKAGPFVSTINVIMTDQSIITMGSHFTRYCGLVARAYIRTLNLNPYVTGVYFDEIEVRKICEIIEILCNIGGVYFRHMHSLVRILWYHLNSQGLTK